MKKSIKIIIGLIIILFLIGIIMFLNLNKKMIVGKDIKNEDINEFYWTYSTSTFPPTYQRYHFYLKDNEYYLYHESRNGETFPLTEKDIDKSGTIKLNEEEINRFFELLDKGTVVARKEYTDTGRSGPWTFLYHKKDKNKYQEFSFYSYQLGQDFENYCIELINKYEN